MRSLRDSFDQSALTAALSRVDQLDSLLASQLSNTAIVAIRAAHPTFARDLDLAGTDPDKMAAIASRMALEGHAVGVVHALLSSGQESGLDTSESAIISLFVDTYTAVLLWLVAPSATTASRTSPTASVLTSDIHQQSIDCPARAIAAVHAALVDEAGALCALQHVAAALTAATEQGESPAGPEALSASACTVLGATAGSAARVAGRCVGVLTAVLGAKPWLQALSRLCSVREVCLVHFGLSSCVDFTLI